MNRFWRILNVCLLTLVAGLTAAAARAQEVVSFPEEDPGPPYYARIRSGFVVHTDQLAAIVFYRQPGCVPSGFNLLDLFNAPEAFSCMLTVEGFEVFKPGPRPPGTIPKQVKSFGLGAVPVWFASWPELQTAIADGVLTLPELMALPSLRVGSAGSFQETLHPTGGAEHPELTMVASGVLSTGQTFFLQVAANGNPLSLKNVIIRFK